MSGNGNRIIPIGTPAQAEEKYKICHRTMTATVVMGQVAPGQTQPVAVGASSPCIGPRCRMWSEDIEECSEVFAARRIIPQLANLEESLDGINCQLGDIMQIMQPPSGGRAPRQVEIVNIESPTLTALIQGLRNLIDKVK